MVRKLVEPEIRRLALHGLGNIIEAEDYSVFKNCISQFITIFGCKYLTEEIINAYTMHLINGKADEQRYNNLINNVNLCNLTEEEFDEIQEPTTQNQLIREQSPFYAYFIRRRNEIQADM